MNTSTLLTTGCREPIKKSDAKRRGLTVEPFGPGYRAEGYGLVLDRSVWFETRIAPRWIVAFRLVNQRGQPVIAEARIFPDEPGHYPPGRWTGEYGAPAIVPPGGLGARVLRQIRTRAFEQDLRTIMAHKIFTQKGVRRDEPWSKEEWEMTFPGLPPALIPPSATRGRKGRSDHELARIAAIYERAYLAKRPATEAVAKTMRISPEKARDAIRRARVRGLLSPATKQGKGGGLLTERGKKIVNVKKQKGGTRHGQKR